MTLIDNLKNLNPFKGKTEEPAKETVEAVPADPEAEVNQPAQPEVAEPAVGQSAEAPPVGGNIAPDLGAEAEAPPAAEQAGTAQPAESLGTEAVSTTAVQTETGQPQAPEGDTPVITPQDSPEGGQG